jgi:hypothetical protein
MDLWLVSSDVREGELNFSVMIRIGTLKAIARRVGQYGACRLFRLLLRQLCSKKNLNECSEVSGLRGRVERLEQVKVKEPFVHRHSVK